MRESRLWNANRIQRAVVQHGRQLNVFFLMLLPCDVHFYRAMHVVLARYCYRMSFVRLSVRPSVTLRYRGHIGWISSKLVTRIISLGSSLLGYTALAI